MPTKTVLISGIGIGGPTLAFWLNAAGFTPTLVERAPALRSGGYVIDFWGLGYDIAERMGLLAEINRVGYHMRELRMVDARGRRVAGFGTAVFEELTGGRYVTLRPQRFIATAVRQDQGRLRDGSSATTSSRCKTVTMASRSNCNAAATGGSTC